jgi:oligoendopeptidase F
MDLFWLIACVLQVSSPEDMTNMMVKAWSGRYGDALESGMDPMFWASKLHFYMTSPQFYNFPYTFGYLFALGVCKLTRNPPLLVIYTPSLTDRLWL